MQAPGVRAGPYARAQPPPTLPPPRRARRAARTRPRATRPAHAAPWPRPSPRAFTPAVTSAHVPAPRSPPAAVTTVSPGHAPRAPAPRRRQRPDRGRPPRPAASRDRLALCWRGAAQRAPAAARSPPASSSSSGSDSSGSGSGSGSSGVCPGALSSLPMVPRRRSAAAWAPQGRAGGGGGGARTPIGLRGRRSRRPSALHRPISAAEAGGGAASPAPRASHLRPRASQARVHLEPGSWRRGVAPALKAAIARLRADPARKRSPTCAPRAPSQRETPTYMRG